MIPHPVDALSMLSQRLMTELLPEVTASYAAGDGMLIGLLMNALAAELSDGIKHRIDDIAEMKVIFRDVADRFADLELEELIEMQPVDLSLKEVNIVHDACTRGLTSLHELVESAQGASAKEIEVSIWQYLQDHCERHEVRGVG